MYILPLNQAHSAYCRYFELAFKEPRRSLGPAGRQHVQPGSLRDGHSPTSPQVLLLAMWDRTTGQGTAIYVICESRPLGQLWLSAKLAIYKAPPLTGAADRSESCTSQERSVATQN